MGREAVKYGLSILIFLPSFSLDMSVHLCLSPRNHCDIHLFHF